MKKIIFTSMLCTAFLTACGGGGGGGSSAPNTVGTGTNPTGTPNGTETGNTVDPQDQGGQTGNFGDSADQANGRDAQTTVCPATTGTTFTGWVRLDATQWCVKACPDGASNVDGGAFGLVQATGEVCRDTAVAAGGAVTAPLFAAINGCPAGGCADNSTDDFPQVLVSISASATELGRDRLYRCMASLFDERTDRWIDDPALPEFSLALEVGGSAGEFAADASRDSVVANTTWSFSNGTLSLEGGRQMSNVAVGNGRFSSWASNTSLIRCTADQ